METEKTQNELLPPLEGTNEMQPRNRRIYALASIAVEAGERGFFSVEIPRRHRAQARYLQLVTGLGAAKFTIAANNGADLLHEALTVKKSDTEAFLAMFAGEPEPLVLEQPSIILKVKSGGAVIQEVNYYVFDKPALTSLLNSHRLHALVLTVNGAPALIAFNGNYQLLTNPIIYEP